METQKAPNPNQPSLDLEYLSWQENASKGRRFVNYLIDGIMIGFGYGIISTMFSLASVWSLDGMRTYGIASFFLSFSLSYAFKVAYYTILEGTTGGRSIGKYVTRTMAVNRDNQPVTMEQALLRSLCRLIPFNAVAGLLDRTFHDSITNTRVIRKSL